MSEYNILILSAGRRVELVELFQQAAKKLNIKSKVVAGDNSKLAPALYFADDKVILPKISNSDYIPEIIKTSNDKNISLIVPTIDTDLMLLSENKELIENETKAKVLISSEEVVSICRDKIKSQRFFEQNGFLVPRLHEEITKDLDYPLFIKPRDGSSSINTFKVNNKDELDNYLKIIDKPMIQDYIEGEEYTVDVFLDFNSNIITVVPRLRIATRSGEISKGKIVKDKGIINEVKKLMNVLKPIGHITVQLMKTKKGIEFIEINPRFGGGAPMSIMSGANSCLNLYRLLMGEKLEYNEEYTDNDIYLRFDKSIRLDNIDD